MDGNKVEKRHRPPVSCEPCRTRKLKCNRALPCDACTHRKKPAACHYAPNANRNPTTRSVKTRELNERLKVLEALVSSAVSDGSTAKQGTGVISPNLTPGTTSHQGSSNALTPETPHLQQIGDGRFNYIDAGHWESILNKIREVRDDISQIDAESSRRRIDLAEPDASFLFHTAGSLDDILTWLPSRGVCDRLVSLFFKTPLPISAIIHPIKFQGEYEKFWAADGKNQKPLWIALLFSILATMAQVQLLGNLALDSSAPHPRDLRKCTTQCLVLGNYTVADAHALEAFLLHIQCLLISSESHGVDTWFEMGTITRLAFRLGYHRDPDNLPDISAFDGEMRRRVWHSMFQLEALLAWEMGFPSMIPSEFCDTRAPRNLDYSELWPGMDLLPPGRPISDSTPIRYGIVKASVMGVFKKIAAHAQSISTPVYETTLALDAEMEQAYSRVPEGLQRRDVGNSLMDDTSLIMHRATIEILYLKGLIILHRRFVRYDSGTDRFDASRRKCVKAALDMLHRQADLYEACSPGGRLHEDRCLFFNLPVHDFLLAAMVVCLDLSVSMRSEVESHSDSYKERVSREYEALRTCQRLWPANACSVPQTQSAALVLDLMISKTSQVNRGLLEDYDTWPPLPAPSPEDTGPYADFISDMINSSDNADWVNLLFSTQRF